MSLSDVCSASAALLLTIEAFGLSWPEPLDDRYRSVAPIEAARRDAYERQQSFALRDGHRDGLRRHYLAEFKWRRRTELAQMSLSTALGGVKEDFRLSRRYSKAHSACSALWRALCR